MCGICGAVSFDPDRPVDETTLRRMGVTLVHRGPDDEGYHVDEIGRRVGLGIRRLSIIDLVTGHQPITNETHTLWLVFNGELYNYRELRGQLEERGHSFASQSDAEVVIHAYEEHGSACLDHFNGMFAFAIWDAHHRRLFLARDRLGIKPLYYWATHDQIVFGSELKALMAHPDVPREIDLTALDQFVTLEYIPAPRTIFQGVYKLLPGHWLIFEEGALRLEQYWDIPFRQAPDDENDAPACVEMLADLIRDAVRLQLVSDVPLGAFLSGGMDSSTVVAMMSRATSAPVRTFSIGFDDATYNELPYARSVAARFKTEHQEEVLHPDIAALTERLASHLDEPFADSSIFSTYLVSELASRSVKVVLSGDGGDELFGGYDTYVAQYYDRMYRWLPGTLRERTIPALLDRLPPRPAKKGWVNKAKRFVEGGALPPSLQHTRWMMFMRDDDKRSLYRPALRDALDTVGSERETGESAKGDTAAALLARTFQRAAQSGASDPLAQQQYVDIKTYLADDILTKVDRMSMAVSLEARVPLLDHRIVEFALNLPARLKLHRGQTKVALRQAMRNQLPEAVLNKPKQGFSIPLKHWLCGPLRAFMLDLLSTESIRRRGYFEPGIVARWVTEHLHGRANHSHRLWALMVFELWQQRVLEGVRIAR